jgi:predicted GIY-YIG superfamily endonuclease
MFITKVLVRMLPSDWYIITLSKYTCNKGPWELVYSNAFESKKEALIEELRLKKLNRKSIESLIMAQKQE